MPSIRRFLLLSIILILVTTTAVIATWDYVHFVQDMEQIFDAQLIENNNIIRAVLTADLNIKRLQLIQRTLEEGLQSNQANKAGGAVLCKDKEFRHMYEVRHVFQVLDSSGQMLLRSTYAPEHPLLLNAQIKPGFSEADDAGYTWKIFTQVDMQHKFVIFTAQREDIRSGLGAQIASEHLLPMLFVFPLLGLLIWVSIGHSLAMLKKITQEVSNKNPDNLEPLRLSTEPPEEIRPLIEELNRLFSILQQALDREKHFTANAAHELKTPLATLKTQIQVALKAKEDEKSLALDKVIAGVDRCNHLINQLLTLSKVSAASALSDLKLCNLTTIARESIAELVPMALKKNIELELREPQTIVPLVKVNEILIKILLRNLIDNAIRYTPDGGLVLTTICATDDGVKLCVIDNGPGIPEEYRTRVFERFYRRLGNVSTGSGLGLSIVKTIADLHKIRITLDEPVGHAGLQICALFPVN